MIFKSFSKKDYGPLSVAYGVLLSLFALVFFNHVVEFPFEVDDSLYMVDSSNVASDIAYFWSSNKHFPGRPTVEIVFWLGYELWGEQPAFYHGLVIFVHLIASLLLSMLARRIGMGLIESFLVGLLFLINVAHFRALYWVSAIAYPLALVFILVALLCHIRWIQSGRNRWLWGVYSGFLLAVLSHGSAAMGLVIALVMAWDRPWQSRVKIVFLGAVCALSISVIGNVYDKAPQIEQSSFSFLDIFVSLPWMLSRLLTTAHWIVFPLNQMQWWEPITGFFILVGCGISVRMYRSPVFWGCVWSVLFCLPFLSRSTQFIEDIHSGMGPSRYLYIASAGSTIVIALFIRHLVVWVRKRYGFIVSGGVLWVILVSISLSSFFALKDAGFNAFYCAGMLANVPIKPEGRVENERAISALERAVMGSGHVVPLANAYFVLASLKVENGEDPLPVLTEAKKRLPGDMAFELFDLTAQQLSGVEVDSRLHELRRIDPGSFDYLRTVIYHRYGQRYYAEKQYEEALQCFQRALNKESQHPWIDEIMLYKLTLQMRMERYPEARKTIEAMIKINPKNKTAIYQLVKIQALQGNNDAAKATFLRLQELDQALAKKFVQEIQNMSTVDVSR